MLPVLVLETLDSGYLFDFIQRNFSVWFQLVLYTPTYTVQSPSFFRDGQEDQEYMFLCVSIVSLLSPPTQTEFHVTETVVVPVLTNN